MSYHVDNLMSVKRSNRSAALWILHEQGTCHFILGHLSRNNNTVQLAYDTVRQTLDGTGATLHTAPMLGNLTVSTEVI